MNNNDLNTFIKIIDNRIKKYLDDSNFLKEQLAVVEKVPSQTECEVKLIGYENENDPIFSFPNRTGQELKKGDYVYIKTQGNKLGSGAAYIKKNIEEIVTKNFKQYPYLNSIPWYTENMKTIDFLNSCPAHESFLVTINEHSFSDFPVPNTPDYTYHGLAFVLCGSANYRIICSITLSSNIIYLGSKRPNTKEVKWNKIEGINI